VLFYAVLAGGITWLAVTRWNGVPADSSASTRGGASGPPPPIDPARDRTEELAAALRMLPPEPALTLPPPPEGMRWKGRTTGSIELWDVLNGPWTPPSRPNLAGVIAFLETPVVDKALVRIAEIEPGGWRPYGPKSTGFRALEAAGRAAKLRMARARYHHAGQGDIGAALSDLEAVYRLGGITVDSGELIGVLLAVGCEQLADAELRHLAREHELTPAQAGRIINTIQSNMLDLPDLWRKVTDCVVAHLQFTVDLCWTKDGGGDGWLVLSHLDDIRPPAWAPKPRSGAWNLLSPVFNDRRTVERKIARLAESYDRVAELSHSQAIAALEAIETRPTFNLADGPLAPTPIPEVSRSYRSCVYAAASRSAAIVAAALSAYQHDHGRYPFSLDALRDRGYLETIPLDPFVDRPLRYRQEDRRFILYSVGPNGIDDGGERQTNQAMPRRSPLADDLSYNRPRPEPWAEPVLEEVAP